MAGRQRLDGALLRFRATNRDIHEVPLRDARAADLAAAEPWRTFRWHKGQQHYSGWWWSSTIDGHVIYESRLELARLILADFDPSVRVIVAQPFQIETRFDGRVRRHVPDFLLVDDNDTVQVVNVKPRERLHQPKVADALGWAHGLFDQRGWRTEIWSGTDSAVMANVRFLAGFRRHELLDPDVLAATPAVAATATIGDTEERLADRWPQPLIRPAIMHLLWTGALQTELSTPLSRDSLLEVAV